MKLLAAFRQKYCLYLLLLDPDDLKAHNDKYGHQQADNLIKKTSGNHTR